MSDRPRLLLAAESMAATNSGIARVARLVSRVLSGLQSQNRCRATALSFRNTGEPASPGLLPARSSHGSRLNFVQRLSAALFRYDAFIYDGPGMARGHQWLPWPRRPFLTWCHGIESWPGTAHPKQVETAKRADSLIAITAFSRDRARQNEPSYDRARVCWLATEADVIPAIPRTASGPPRVTILSRVDHFSYKGHPELIRCWPRVRAAVPDAVLTIAGSGPGLEEMRTQARQTGLPETSIEIRGFIPEADLDRLWSETTVFAMPSRGEGFGLVYIEAMRWGIPVVASVHDAGQEINLHGQTGWNVNLDHPEELAEALIDLLRNREQADAFGRNGQRRWEHHFRYTAFRERFETILQDFVARTGKTLS